MKELTTLYQEASDLLDLYCASHRSEKKENLYMSYRPISASNIFESKETSEILFSIQDEAYSYLRKVISTCNTQNTLLNIFSGSGRLIQELKQQKLLGYFREIYNLDKSKVMIAFEKTKFYGEQFRFLCEDILNLTQSDIRYDIAVCHCGIRYINPDDYGRLIDVLMSLKKDENSYCVITEVNEQFLSLLQSILREKQIEYTYMQNTVKMQRNNTLYLSLIYYHENQDFRMLVDEISLKKSVAFSQVLKELSGYKITDMHRLLF